MKKSMRILCIIFAIVCFAYYIRCAAYAGVKSSFIWIWLVGTAAFCILYILGLLEDRHIYTLPRMVKYISLVIICFGTALFITLEMCITFCMKKEPEDNCDYIIVLGCQIRGDRITKSLKNRLDAAYDYAYSNQDTRIIVSGGQGKGENKTEALAMYEYLCSRGISSERIVMEDKSTDTNENMLYSVRYIDDCNAKVGIVTNDFHIFRAKLLARGKGLNNICGIPAPSDEVLFVNYMVREAVGIVKDFVYGNYQVK